MNRPKITIITGVSVDGKITIDKNASSKVFDESISSDAFVPLVDLKETADAVMVGSNTIIADDANLIGNEFYSINNKIRRIVTDSSCKIPLDAKIYANQPQRTIIVTTEKAPLKRVEQIRKIGAEVLVCGKEKVDLADMFEELKEIGINSVIVEGGGTLNYSLVKDRLVDELIVVFFPFAVGMTAAPALFEGEGFPNKLLRLKLRQIRVLTQNIFAYYIPEY